jgi:ATP-binding protein involved in chromosome partitioning
MSLNKETVEKALSQVPSPAGSVMLTQSGELKNIQVFGNEVDIDLEIRNPALHVRKRLEEQVQAAISKAFGSAVKLRLNITAKAPEQTAKGPESMRGVKNIIAVASGKGGVGKSTVTANLALGLAELGYKVGLVDADIYGPSMPIMFDVVHEKPRGEVIDGKQYIIPVESHGVKLLSIGFFADPNQAIVWRGPMATKAINQLFADAWWGDLDYMVLDLPPGTGDIHLTLVQAVQITGVVVVSTPQEIALADARKGVAMFQLPSINVPVLGLVENMAWFTPAELPNNRYYIFGKEGTKGLAEQMNVPLLGQIPLVQSIREAGDAGRPAILQGNTPVANAFREMTKNVVEQVQQRNVSLPPTQRLVNPST